MTVENEPYVKIRFEVEDPDDPDQYEVETVWAKPLDVGYQIDNIPFCAYSVALGDIVEATSDDDRVLSFERVIKPSGNSVVRLIHTNAADVQSTRNELRAMGCTSELMGTNLVAVDVPAAIDYSDVRAYLERRAAESLFDYEEACLGHLPLSGHE